MGIVINQLFHRQRREEEKAKRAKILRRSRARQRRRRKKMRKRRLRRKKGRKPVKGRKREKNEHRGGKRSKEGGVRSLLRQVDNRGPAGRKSKQNGNKTSENIEGISVADEKDVIISQKNLPRRNQLGRGGQRRSQRRRKGKSERGKKKGGRAMRVVLRSQLKSLKSVEELEENNEEEDKLTEEEKEEERKRKMRKRMKRLRKSRQLYLEQEQYRLVINFTSSIIIKVNTTIKPLITNNPTWNLSKNLHRRIFRLKILHRQFQLISTVFVGKYTKNK